MSGTDIGYARPGGSRTARTRSLSTRGAITCSTKLLYRHVPYLLRLVPTPSTYAVLARGWYRGLYGTGIADATFLRACYAQSGTEERYAAASWWQAAEHKHEIRAKVSHSHAIRPIHARYPSDPLRNQFQSTTCLGLSSYSPENAVFLPLILQCVLFHRALTSFKRGAFDQNLTAVN
eukprot:1442847-Rhodomonas_salina.2